MMQLDENDYGAQEQRGHPFAVQEVNFVEQDGNLPLQSGMTGAVAGYPMSQEEAYHGSMQAFLRRNIGRYIVAGFLIGTEQVVSWEGYLHEVGNNYIVLYQKDEHRYLLGDLYSLKFVELSRSGEKMATTGNRRRDAAAMW